jgi:hypothetical protein
MKLTIITIIKIVIYIQVDPWFAALYPISRRVVRPQEINNAV